MHVVLSFIMHFFYLRVSRPAGQVPSRYRAPGLGLDGVDEGDPRGGDEAGAAPAQDQVVAELHHLHVHGQLDLEEQVQTWKKGNDVNALFLRIEKHSRQSQSN